MDDLLRSSLAALCTGGACVFAVFFVVVRKTSFLSGLMEGIQKSVEEVGERIGKLEDSLTGRDGFNARLARGDEKMTDLERRVGRVEKVVSER